MAEEIIDGTGSGNRVRVDANKQMHTFSVTESEKNSAVEHGNGYNLNTGIVALTGTGDSAMLYLKNDESALHGESDLVIDSIIVGVNTRSATITESAIVTIHRNPTGGTIVSDASALPMISNSNFGSNNTLESIAYGASATGKTITGGTTHAIVLLGARTAIPELYIDLPKGAAIGVSIDLNTSGGANAYVAVICHRKDGNDI